MNLIKINKVKIALFVFLAILLSSCSISKGLIENQKIIRNNNLYINNQLTPKDTLNSLFLQKKNSTFIGIPISALIYSASKDNTDSIFDNWVSQKNKRSKLNTIFSKKQVNQLKEEKDV